MRGFTRELLAPLGPEETAIEELFRRYVDDDMLRLIAEADYGEGADQCFAALKAIRDDGRFPEWNSQLFEVLGLTCFDAPEDGDRGRWRQLFASAALLRMGVGFPGPAGRESEWLGPFVSWAIQLGDDVARAGGSFVAWRFQDKPGRPEERAYFALAILLLAVRTGTGTGAWWNELAEWVEAEEAAAEHRASDVWLYGLTHERSAEGWWRWSLREVLVRPKRAHPAEAEEALSRLVRLAG